MIPRSVRYSYSQLLADVENFLRHLILRRNMRLGHVDCGLVNKKVLHRVVGEYPWQDWPKLAEVFQVICQLRDRYFSLIGDHLIPSRPRDKFRIEKANRARRARRLRAGNTSCRGYGMHSGPAP